MDKFKTEQEQELPQKKYGARPELTTKQKLELSKAFGIFYSRGCGLIEQRGFMLAMRALGFEPKFNQVDELIAKVTGRTDKETLDFKDFYNLLTVVMTGDDSKEDVRKAFKMFSSPETGVISLDNLEAINQELGQDISREKLHEMITFADKNGDGVIDLQEFIAMMERPMLEYLNSPSQTTRSLTVDLFVYICIQVKCFLNNCVQKCWYT